jgi:dipeptidyl aminopeptidase/acylaminoacyl peptidase
VVRSLANGVEREIPEVRSYTFAHDGDALAYAVASTDENRDGLYAQRLSDGVETTVHALTRANYSSVTWSKEGALAFLMTREDEAGKPDPSTQLSSWKWADTRVLASATDAPDGWIIPVGAPVAWSDDGADIYFGWRPRHADEPEGTAEPAPAPDTETEKAFDAYDTEAILSGRGVDVWHWKDPVINPQQKIVWNREQSRTWRAVHHVADGSTVALAGLDLPDVDVPANGRVALGRSELPYLWESTWTGGATDVYVVDVVTGSRTEVAKGLGGGRPDLSPGGRFVAYWDSGDYHLFDVAARTTSNITRGLGVDFADEDHDTPDEPGGYGVGGWTEGDAAVLVYDKFDIWVIPTDGGPAWSLTDGKGRQERHEYRVIDTDPETDAIGAGDRLLLSSYDDVRKNFGFYGARMDRPGVTRLLEEERRFQFMAKASDADVVLFTREDYGEFPDLWVAKSDLSDAHKVTDVNPQIADFAWGTSELTEWRSADGTMLQGVVIKPGNYDPARRYPVLVYYYELFSQRLHEFNEPAVNHRPSFPLYASNGYVVFLPDVRFEIGRPGYSATKAIVPGVQHLVDMGLADPDAMALHGHSWSGYQTAQVVTQTDIFRTAITGAPVANMTSAYSGIRWGSGLARQFQYEKGQSRLSGSLWEARDEYIDNSPVFFADRIHTPMLILHGDKDDAVPWYQSIELYLAMRRLGKEAVFLQYRDEPHHPQKYPNRLDWAIRMKEWLDHYLKGAPPAAWITGGLPYSGR